MDLGTATKDLLEKVRISAESGRKFKGLYKQIWIGSGSRILEKTPLNFCLVRNASCLAPMNMIRQPKQTSIRFRALAYKLFSLKKISSDVADQAKNQYDELLNLLKYEKNNEFRNFDSKKDRLDAFLCKLIFVMSHGQSNVERGFSVNEEVLQDNLQAKSLISQRL